MGPRLDQHEHVGVPREYAAEVAMLLLGGWVCCVTGLVLDPHTASGFLFMTSGAALLVGGFADLILR